MQSKDTKVECIVEKKGSSMLVFKGFMANGVQANWNVVWIVYGTRDPTLKMVDKEWTCFFHWI
jgi:hypothetical protein